MENFCNYCFEEKDFVNWTGSFVPLNFLIERLNNCFKKENENFAEICFLVKQIHDLFLHNELCRVYLKNDKTISYGFDTIMIGFGINKSESSRLIKCFEKYCFLSSSDITKAKCDVIEEFKGFSKSKLFELLCVDNQTLFTDLKNKVIRFDMTVQQLRKYVKNYQALLKVKTKDLSTRLAEQLKEIEQENIPKAYNPSKHYEFNYFESKTKAQLLNIVWELQKECEKLRKELKKK